MRRFLGEHDTGTVLAKEPLTSKMYGLSVALSGVTDTALDYFRVATHAKEEILCRLGKSVGQFIIWQ